ncbi:hypothetical protein J2I47_07990 [Fibrella sp. HMF5335]|uniref:Uncharacterized protein n=1 Tax=Fibrella rubiginis TaxID=2817060 RepID=A0A939GGQ1_9BACT|nr:hypothetical protein [Fibrella rubiginis]MBO0936480.1 hypothetical protein [Fibrella rubiginis]
MAKDSIWIHPHKFNKAKFERYEQKIVFIFEVIKADTVSIRVDGRLVVKEYMITAGDIGRVERSFVIARPRIGTITLETVDHGCTRFKLRKGYKYAYLNQTLPDNEWLITYSNYPKMYF